MSLVVHDLSVSRGGKAIVSGASFTAPTNAITGLIGPNGAGKSTLLASILGLIPSSGTATFHGQSLPDMPRRQRAQLAALVEQSSTTEERLTVHDVVALGRIPFQPFFATTPAGADEAIIEAALRETGMSAFADRRFHTLSGGEQQRVHIARALAQEPRLLLLDEPTSHLDISAQLQLIFLLRRRATTTTILVALHDLNLAARCDHLVVLKSGRVAAQGTPSNVLTSELLREIYGVSARLVPDPVSGRPLVVYDEPQG